MNFALTYPETVAALYLDAPVLDIRSWPGGKGIGVGHAGEWETCKACYDLHTEEEAEAFAENPLDNAEKLALTGIPVMLVAGDSDEVVPYVENGEPFSDRYEEVGGRITVILKADCGHHPHSLENPAPILEFIALLTGFECGDIG